MTIGQPQPTREAIANLEVGHTTVAPATVFFLVAMFFLFICAVPAFELAMSVRDGSGEKSWDHLLRIPEQMHTQEIESAPLWRHIVLVNRVVMSGLHAFEEALEDASRVGGLLRPRAQLLMTRWLGAGNELAYVGRDGWLFYRPDVEYATGAGFLDHATQRRRASKADEWTAPPQTDPRTAIVQLKADLEARGIQLIVMPTPVKASLHPERLSSRAGDARLPVHNPSYAAFVEDLRNSGVAVFDPAEVMIDAMRATSAPQYLATDTHWRPEAMEAVAERLAEFVRMRVQLPPVDASYQTHGTEVQRLGDIADMLDLPETQSLFVPEAVAIRRVVDARGEPWRPARDADVLVLGDSFSNIYSLASMGWGDSAGLIEHLSFALQRPVDRIVQNDNGAHATREALHREGSARLAGKRVVIYQFATRELAFGDWKIFGSDGR
jgi:hypothetical protein